MKYINKLNGMTYWIENGIVLCGNKERATISGFTEGDMLSMIEDGVMTPIRENAQ